MAKVFVIDMVFDIKDLHTLPPDVKGAVGVFFSIVIQSVVKWGEDKGGMVWEEHVVFRQIRYKIEEAINTNETKIRLTTDEYAFFTKAWKEAKTSGTGNEVICRVGQNILSAKPEEDKKQ